MAAAPDDWRRMGQERDLPRSTTLVWRAYQARSKTWEHEHCVFCGTKLMDPGYSEAHRRFIEEHDDVLTAGYTTTAEHSQGVAYHWDCPGCVADFAEEFGLLLEGGSSDGPSFIGIGDGEPDGADQVDDIVRSAVLDAVVRPD